MFCPMCGTAAADNAAFCSSCGNSLKIEETPAKEEAVTAAVEEAPATEAIDQAPVAAPAVPVAPVAPPAPVAPQPAAASQPTAASQPAAAPVIQGKYKPVSSWGYVGYEILFMIPIIGFIFQIVFAFSKKNLNRRNFARSFFCWYLLAAIVGLLALLLLFVLILVGALSSDILVDLI